MKKIAFKAFVVFSAFLFFSNNCFSQSQFSFEVIPIIFQLDKNCVQNNKKFNGI